MKKNSEIHEGLPQREIRDFLSLSLVKLYDDDCKNKKEYPTNDTDDAFEHAIIIAETDIKYLKIYVKNIRTRQAILKLIEQNGWFEHDVSDDTRNDNYYKLSMNFIGTEEEYIKFYTELYPEDEQ
ncbi:MAG: hypothetical protein PF487_08325 [Bacteroidales bacterium]|jgi:hypothetical protein|nr:hypothetical protein [Bacteroidales bacterium]